jgi:ABC-type branched-subunit amino acid transport system permease subunit
VGRAKAVPRAIALPAAIVGAALLIAVPSLVGARLPVYTHGLTLVILFLSLALLVRTSGQISLCHAAFAAFGATSFAHLSTGAGLPWFIALILAGCAVVPIGAIVALPAIRLSGVYLALATFGFGLLMERVIYGSGLMFGALGYRKAPRPFFARSETSFYFLVLVIAVCATALVMLVIRTRLGRLLRGLGESPVALTTNGLGVSVTRVIVFSISAFLAGIAGALFASAGGNVGVRGFGAFDSLLFLVVLLAVGREVVSSSIVAAVAVAVAPAYLPDWFLEQQSLIFGLSAIAAVSLAGLHVRDRRAADRATSSPVKARLHERAPIPAVAAS